MPGPLRIELVDADHEHDAVLLRDRGEAVRVGARDGERLPVEEREGGLRARVGPAGERLRPRRGRVGGHERLGEDDELGALSRGLGRPLGDAVDRARAVEDRGLDLDARDLDGVLHAQPIGS